jgi:hypothetical protein
MTASFSKGSVRKNYARISKQNKYREAATLAEPMRWNMATRGEPTVALSKDHVTT